MITKEILDDKKDLLNDIAKVGNKSSMIEDILRDLGIDEYAIGRFTVEQTLSNYDVFWDKNATIFEMLCTNFMNGLIIGVAAARSDTE